MFFELNEEKMKMNYFKTFVTIDEADFMFDIGFQHDIDEIVSVIKDKTTK